jgi:hypothetical protein
MRRTALHRSRKRHSPVGLIRPATFDRPHGYGRDRSTMHECRDVIQRRAPKGGIAQVGSTGDRRSWSLL